jgi:hypothetical protein
LVGCTVLHDPSPPAAAAAAVAAPCLRPAAWQSQLEDKEKDLKQREAALKKQQDAAAKTEKQVEQEQQRLAAEGKRLQVIRRTCYTGNSWHKQQLLGKCSWHLGPWRHRLYAAACEAAILQTPLSCCLPFCLPACRTCLTAWSHVSARWLQSAVSSTSSGASRTSREHTW